MLRSVLAGNTVDVGKQITGIRTCALILESWNGSNCSPFHTGSYQTHLTGIPKKHTLCWARPLNSCYLPLQFHTSHWNWSVFGTLLYSWFKSFVGDEQLNQAWIFGKWRKFEMSWQQRACCSEDGTPWPLWWYERNIAMCYQGAGLGRGTRLPWCPLPQYN